MKESSLYLLHSSVPLDCIARIGARRLSEVLTESLLTLHEADYSCPEAQELTHIMRGEPFIRTLTALLESIDHSNSDKDKTSLFCPEVFSNLSIAFVPELQVVYHLKYPNRSDSIVDVGTHTRLSFVRNSESERTILVNSTLLISPVTAELAVATGLCDALRISSTYAGTIAVLLQSSRSADSGIMSHLQIAHEDSYNSQHVRGQPGAVILADDEAYLELKPFRIFRNGEIVAYKTSRTDGRVCYGRVLAVSDTGEGGLRRIRLAGGNDTTVEVLSTEVRND